MPKKSAESSKNEESSLSLTPVSNPKDFSITKAGWLQKWTNYIKGYRQRWFVLDSSGNLSYYRNQSEIISATSQSFHLKAQNEVDRLKWLTALEYARHNALKRADSDDENDCFNAESDISVIFESKKEKNISKQIKTEMNAKLEDLKKSRIKIDYQNLSKFASNEHEQRIQLREQLETLARQHRNLETMAFNQTNNLSNESNLEEASPYAENEDDEFHDAPDDFEASTFTKNIDKTLDSRKSSSTQYYKQLRDANEEQINSEIFNTDIIVKKTNSVGGMDFDKQNIKDYYKGDINEVISIELPPIVRSNGKKRRETIPNRLQASISLWSIMRNSIGKDLSKIAMPVNFNEPLSTCQRITEDLEYAYLLDRAAEKMDSCEQMCYVAAYAISSYSTTGNRTTKPFNPILGETFECDRMNDLGWRSLTEQVSHHPPATAHHAEGKHWSMFQEISILSKFRGKYLSVTPQGHTHVIINNSNGESHYTYKKVTTTVHNIIVGKLWIDNHGEMHIENHNTGDQCIVKFHAYSYFSSEKAKRVNAIVKNKDGVVKYLLQGFWDKYIDLLQVTKHQKGDKTFIETLSPRRIWTINLPYKNSDKMYYFTKLAIELNEPEDNVAPTDSRLRSDQRLMEKGEWDEANKRKNELEEKQRLARKMRTAEAEKAMQAGLLMN